MTNLIEIFGYFAMIVVLISIVFTNIITLRIVNTMACVLFVLYGILIHSNPIIIMNILCIIINIYKLSKYKANK